MKTVNQVLPLLLILSVALLSCNQSKPTEVEISKQEMKIRAEEMMKSIRPGEEHKILGTLEGSWLYTCQLQNSTSAQSIFSSTGKTSNKQILEGRFLLSESTKNDSLPLSLGLLILGYDRGLKKYTLSIFGEGGTNFVTTTGDISKTMDEIQTSGANYNPILKIEERYEVNVKFIDANKYSVNILFKDKMAKSTMGGLNIVYTRDYSN